MMTTTTQFKQVSLSSTRHRSTQRTSLAQTVVHTQTITTIRPRMLTTTTSSLSMRYLVLIRALVDSKIGRHVFIIRIPARLHPHLLLMSVLATITTWHQTIVLAALRTPQLDLKPAHLHQWGGPKLAFRQSHRSLELEVATADRLHVLRVVG